MKEGHFLLQDRQRSRKPLLLPSHREPKIQAYRVGLHDTCLSDIECEDDGCSRKCEIEVMPSCHLLDSEKGIVWSPNAAYNADLSCFT